MTPVNSRETLSASPYFSIEKHPKPDGRYSSLLQTRYIRIVARTVLFRHRTPNGFRAFAFQFL